MSGPKHVLITGAGRGLGRHIALRALEAGYEVTGLARTQGEVGHDDYPMILCDVSDAAAVAAAFRTLRGRPLWGLIAAAGAASMNLHLTTPPETMRRLLSVNLLGTMLCAAEAGRLMARHRQGRIITFSSIAVALGLAGEASYVAAKSGIEGFSRAFAREMAPLGITVNVVAPGPVKTALIRGVPETKIAALGARQVLPGEMTAEDVWHSVSWLLDERSAALSGEVLHVGGV